MAADKLPEAHHLAPINSRTAFAGHVGHLTPEQEAALQQFKERLAAEGYYTAAQGEERASSDDTTLVRFLRARKFDVAGAYQQFTAAEDWRRELDVDNLYDTFDVDEFQLAREVYPQWTGRRDKTGLPVYVYEVGALEKRKTDAYAKETARLEPRMIALYEHMVQFVLPFCSSIPREHEETPISGCATIVDVSNVSLMRFWALKGHMQYASVLATARYAETLGAIYLVGAPSFFSTVWGWIRRWFDPGTVEKINILPASTQTEDLAARIPLSSIPVKYGGTLEWTYGAPGPQLDDAARRTLGARDGEDVGPLLSAPVRWRDGKLELKGKGRSEAELARWKDGGRPATNAPATNGTKDVQVPSPSPSPVPTATQPAAPSPSPPASSHAPADAAPAPTPTAAEPPYAPSPLPPPILGVGHSNAPDSSVSASAPADEEGEKGAHDIHAAARENPAAPIKDLAAALEGTTL